ncbi:MULTISPECIES: IclR family transcriptional regulator [unclassified Streptomyces]|uniref:IclR family transcriptional regulator n=1 Tax=unclassified Streptomyces TaxID=2593676 RepID=UPI002365BD27|nr:MULTISPECIES: IclR family transcriptional regulator [unclassified Streptomyces]MDF3146153.1 IclR family transcriptional regulator [Streptomyces sp. T21Q-yed]WDF36488.1 IclR family transcriptional regulator [Streptomyces sp. T12]
MTDALHQPEHSHQPESPVQSVDRAVGILEFLGRHEEAGVTDMAAALGVHKSTASRLATALEVRGLIEQTEERGKYRLGLGLIRLAGAATVRVDLSQQSRRVCEQLADQVAETINLAILDHGAAINIDQVLGPSAITTHNWLGRRTPLHATSSGKILLAHLPESELASRLTTPLERFTPRTVTDPETLRAQLKRARANGCAYSAEEFEKGLNAVAAPVFTFNGEMLAALSASGPSFRLTEQRLPEVSAMVRSAAEEISERLGHFRRTTP